MIGVLLVVFAVYVKSRTAGAATSVETQLPPPYASAGRAVLVHAKRTGRGPVPLVVALSDDETKTGEFETDSGLSMLADHAGFAVVYPESLGGTWAVGPTTPDARYIQDVVRYLSTSWTWVDPARVYLWGFGQGGRLALALACANPTEFAAVGVVGAFSPPPGPDCSAQVPTDREESSSWHAHLSARLWSFSSTKVSGRH
jgi:polyhydroxybutyrate depolymerase